MNSNCAKGNTGFAMHTTTTSRLAALATPWLAEDPKPISPLPASDKPAMFQDHYFVHHQD
jgi:hypothetical protein